MPDADPPRATPSMAWWWTGLILRLTGAAFATLTGDNKELLTIEGASHTDLYDQVDVIPFDRIAAFFAENL